MTDGFRMVGAGIALAAVVVFPVPSQAADPPGQPAPLHGADAMDGKNEPGQDGWSWAPVPRDQAASQSGKTPGTDKSPEKTSDRSRPVPDTGKHLLAGQDPGTPVTTSSSGPGKSAPAKGSSSE